MRVLKKRIGRRIKDLRILNNYPTQASLAEALGVEQSTVARWESGIYAPEHTHLKSLSELFKIPQETIFDFEADVVATEKDLSADAIKGDRKSLQAIYEFVRDELNKKGELIERIEDLEEKIKQSTIPSPSPAIRVILDILATLQDDELRQALALVQSIKRSSDRAAAAISSAGKKHKQSR